MSEITPEDVVADLFAAEDTDYDDSGNGWFHTVEADGNTLKVAITPGKDGYEGDETHHFRAVVVEGDEAPIVLEWPTEMGLSWEDGGDLLTLQPSGDIRFTPRGVDEWDLGPDEALEWAAQLAAMARVSKAAQAATAESEARHG